MVPEIDIRPYILSDYSQVRTVLEEGDLFYPLLDSEEHLRRVIENDPEAILVATDRDKVIGTVSIEDGRIPLIFRLAVGKDYRRQGIGAELMSDAINRLKLRGNKEVGILVEDTNEELKGYYEKLGWGVGNAYRWMYKDL